MGEGQLLLQLCAHTARGGHQDEQRLDVSIILGTISPMPGHLQQTSLHLWVERDVRITDHVQGHEEDKQRLDVRIVPWYCQPHAWSTAADIAPFLCVM